MAHRVVVVGGGTAGLVVAIALRNRAGAGPVTVVRSLSMGTIMVGEGTFADTPTLLHDAIGVPREQMLEQVNPVWKLGVRLHWGIRPYFDFPFSEQYNNQILPSAAKPWGYYHLDDYGAGVSLLARNTPRPPAQRAGYHVENGALIAFLENVFVSLGGVLVDDEIVGVDSVGGAVVSVRVGSQRDLAGDFFVDATGFRGELIHGFLEQPYVSMSDTLFCDRAVVGGWRRSLEPILPYTTMETMDAGWCWRIEHEAVINRGYVYCSSFVSDDAATADFLGKNPEVDEGAVRIVPFAARRIANPWVGNVVAIGNACGFVEPLEATNIQVICLHAVRLAAALEEREPRDSATSYNSYVNNLWVEIRDFLAMHYRFNDRLRTPFWKMAVRETPLGSLEEYVAGYRSAGPRLLSDPSGAPGSVFGHDGHLALLLGLGVPWRESAIV